MLKHTDLETTQPTPRSSNESTAYLKRLLCRHITRDELSKLGMIGAIATGLIGYSFILTVLFSHEFHPVILTLIVLFVVPHIGFCFLWKHKPYLNAKEILEKGGVQSIGTLLEMLTVPSAGRDLDTIYCVLMVLLPQITISDSNLLNARQRKLLHKELLKWGGIWAKPNSMENFVLSVLVALPYLGDQSSIFIVRGIANMRAGTPERKRIKQAAIECLPALRQNVSSVQQSQTLLRASHEPAPDPATLLRPTVPTSSPDTSQLLRAAPGEDREPPPAA